MKIDFDPAKRLRTLEQLGLDMVHASRVFSGIKVTIVDDRKDYGEPRWITFGFLNARMVVIVWTKRGNDLRIISMRKANDKEQEIFRGRMG